MTEALRPHPLLHDADVGMRRRQKHHPTDSEHYRIRDLERKRQQLLREKTDAFNGQAFEQAARLQMQILKLEERLAEARKEWEEARGEEDSDVHAQDIAQVVSRWTGIPVARMVETEVEKLSRMEGELHRRIVAQEDAVRAVSNAIRRNRAGIALAHRPIGSFLFLGPTGVGKTELARALAAFLLDDESRIVRLDMSEYMERHEVSKIIGAPRLHRIRRGRAAHGADPAQSLYSGPAL